MSPITTHEYPHRHVDRTRAHAHGLRKVSSTRHRSIRGSDESRLVPTLHPRLARGDDRGDRRRRDWMSIARSTTTTTRAGVDDGESNKENADGVALGARRSTTRSACASVTRRRATVIDQRHATDVETTATTRGTMERAGRAEETVPHTPGSAYEPRVASLAERVRALSAMTPRGESAPRESRTARAETTTTATTTVVARPTSRRSSVESLLEEYCASAPGSTSPVRLRRERNAYADEVRANQQSPEAWLSFLENEEATYADAAATVEVGKPSASAGSRNGVSLHRLYELATKTIPRRGNVNDENYVRIFLGLARQQMVSNIDDARDTFKFLKSCSIGHKHAIYWCEWAAFGYTFKGEAKAVKILKRGLEYGAEPASAIQCMLDDMQGKRYEPAPQTQHTPFRSLAPQYTSAIKPTNPRSFSRDVADGDANLAKPPTASTPRNLSQRAAALANMQATPTAKFTAPAPPAPAYQPPNTHYVTSSTTMPGSVSSYHSARTGGARGGDKTESSMPPPPPQSALEATVTLRSRLANAKEKYSALSASRPSRVERTPAAEHTPMDPPKAPPSRRHATEHTPTAASDRRGESGSATASANKYTREDENKVIVNGVKYTKLECVGQGGTCKVFKVVSPKRKILALKRIRLDGKETETVAGFIDEIKLLKTLRGRDNIIQLVDAEVCPNEKLIFMVLEFGEIDLAHMLAKREKQRQSHGGVIDDNFLRLYFEQMVEAVNTIHEERIVHSDLKPANFLFVEGALKLIDFGIARAIHTEQAPDHTNILRDHQVGTINYMSPEAILNGQASALGGPMKVGRASDIWSLGCILYQMVYGHTPFSKITGTIQKLHAITDPRHKIVFSPLPNENHALIDLMSRCLERDPRNRISVKEILAHKFLRPFAETASSSSSSEASGLSMTQLQDLLAQIQKHGAEVDVNAVTAEVFRQISSGEPVTLSPIVRKHSKSSTRLYGDENVAPME